MYLHDCSFSLPQLVYLTFIHHYFSNSRGAALIHLQDILYNLLIVLPLL